MTSLRPVTAADTPLLREIFAATRADELALTGWNDVQKAGFIRMQFDMQTAHYDAHFPAANRSVVEVDGEPAGRFYVERNADGIQVIDISLLPAFRGRGIGTGLLRALLEEADRHRLPVGIYVEQNNPAQRLYERLGFAERGTEGIYRQLVRAPQVRPAACTIGD